MLRLPSTLVRTVASLLSYVAVFARVGYRFGDGDHEEVLGQILHKLGVASLQNDFLVSQTKDLWTIRSPFNNLISLFNIGSLEFVFILGHFLLYTLLFYYLIRLAEIYVHKHWALFVPFISVLVFYAKSPGANDLYSAHLIAESFGILFAAMGLYYGLSSRVLLSGIALLLSVLFHPLTGIQVFILLLASNWLQNRRQFLKELKKWLPFIGLSFVYIAWLQFASMEASSSYFSLLVEFRNPHHNLPSAFSMTNLALAVGLIVLCIIAFKSKKSTPFYWVILTLTGMLIYSLGVEVFHSTTIAKTQWFKTSIWLRVWGAIAVLHYVSKLNTKLLPKMDLAIASFCIAILISVAVFNQGLGALSNNPLGYADKDLHQIATRCKNELEPGSLFVQPMDVTGFQFVSQQPLYVSFKSVLHYPSFLSKWHGRLLSVYGELDITKSGFEQMEQARAWYHEPETIYLSFLASEGVKYVLASKPIENQKLEPVFANKSYFVYSLNVN